MTSQTEPADGVVVCDMSTSAGSAVVVAPRSLARQIDEVRCVWQWSDMFGAGIQLCGPNVVVATFPWWDFVDQDLAAKPDGWAPLADTPGEVWDDLEQCWYLSTIELDGWVYVFEGVLDELVDLHGRVVAQPGDAAGRIVAGDTGGSWFKVPVDRFKAAWRTAQDEARQAVAGKPD